MKKYITILFIGITALFTACQRPAEYVICDNGKVVKNGECECPEGYAGDNCDILLLKNLIGSYKGTLTQNDTIVFNNNVVHIDTVIPSPLINASTLVDVDIYANKVTRGYQCKVIDSNNFVFKTATGAVAVEGSVKNNVLQLTHYIDGEDDTHNGTYTYIGIKQ